MPVWAADGTAVFYTAKVDSNVELFQVTLDGKKTQLTSSVLGTLHYHPTPSPDGDWLLYGSKRDGVRQLFVMRLADQLERQLTALARGHAAMWPHWQPAVEELPAGEVLSSIHSNLHGHHGHRPSGGCGADVPGFDRRADRR